MINEQLVQEAVDLFIETKSLESMDAEHPMFEELYQKECQLYVLFGSMSEDDANEYRTVVKYIK
jgi:hypothetical protein